VLGGSGQVGSKLVSKLLQLPRSECSKITLLSRRSLDNVGADERIAVKIVDLDKLGDKASMDDVFKGHNCAFMLMGVGQPSKVSKEELEKIDADIPIAFADACNRNGVKHMSVLSAVGGDSKAKYSSITKTAAGGGWSAYCKGKMEDGIKAMPFTSISIIQPAGIYPGNKNTPSMLGKLNELLNPVIPGKFETSSSTQIAESMVKHMKEQIASKWNGVKLVTGGKAIKDSLIETK
jgi:uncharacterized protein YbjT (DUF2867 family)